MAIRQYKPTTPTRRYFSASTFVEVTKTKPEKSLVTPLKRSGGRNSQGKITTRHRGGGHKRAYRKIDFRREKLEVPAKVAAIEYDPNRTARIALLHYIDGEKRYILCPDKLQVGAIIVSSPAADIQPGNCLPIRNIPVGTLIHNIEMTLGKGGQLCRSAGNSAQLMAKEGDYAQVRLPSGEVRKVAIDCRATIGVVGNADQENISLGKAGRNRWKGKRPTVRGVVMNPRDHPHGGGEGKSPIGRKSPMTKWGKIAMGRKTRRNKATDSMIVRRRQ